ncbi:MAG: methionine adenosyltransferase [Thermomicrobiales bacterium]
MSSFATAERTLFTSESVTEGHPDKLCDQISDAILDAIIADDEDARVACETATTTGLVIVMGEITTSTYVDIPRIVRDVVKDIGYTDARFGFDYQTCGVLTSIKEQSTEIDAAVGEALEVRGQSSETADLDTLGAGDQGMMIGYATNETPEHMPLPIALAHRLARRLTEVRRDGDIAYLRPDGKSQVTVEYRHGKPIRIDSVLVSAQHADDVDSEVIRRDIEHGVIRETLPAEMLDSSSKVFINPSGRFSIGGPMGDAGLTGRKIIVDTYGGMARHGGGAFSGKDPTKVDRSGAYAARYVARNIVGAGLADRCEIQVSYGIGMARPLSVHVETFGTGKISDERIAVLIDGHFDLRPRAIINQLDLWRPIYRQTATYGHFGRPDLDLPWERLDKVEILRDAAGLSAVGTSD